VWVNEPPIVEVVDPEEFRGFCTRFVSEITTWKSPSATNQAAIWNDEIDTRMAIAIWAESKAGENDRQRYFAYMLPGIPAGLMVTSERRGQSLIKIKSLATHPGTQGAGGILVEHAVNLSEKAGYKGCLELNEYAAPEGEAWGFGETEDFQIQLVPGESSKWVKVGQEWRLTKHRVRSPLDIHTWRDLTIGTQVGGIVRRRNFGFMGYPFDSGR
jgi:predicted Fe-S protein YdhL (DUF1289 family)